MVLDQIQNVNDIKNLTEEEIDTLQDEICTFLVESIAKTGGHLASNLGVIELTMALHLSFDLTKDKIVWDVGHQSYTHKILTGRKDGFEHLREYGGMSGFPKTEECEADSFNTGHSSTSISAGLGLAEAREITGQDYFVISVIGDGALTGGMAFEALNNASRMKTNFIIVLNDNNMSISENVGGLSKYLNDFRTADAYMDLKDGVVNSLSKIPVYGDRIVRKIRNAKSGIKQLFVPGMFFEEMGITYLGPVDGSNIKAMRRAFAEAKRVRGPVLVHVLTKKGNGYVPAERHPARFHGTAPFDIETGVPLHKQSKAHYTDVFSTVMKKMGERESKLVAITAAMADGTGLKRFRNLYPERFFDVGIAEEHAVTFAAGMAKSGLKPVFAVYSSFLQRAYDQILHDVCLQNLPVVFAIDRAGLVGKDGATHQGIFDIPYLSMIPNVTVMAPINGRELKEMLKDALHHAKGPTAIKYSRGEALSLYEDQFEELHYGKGQVIKEGSDAVIIGVGNIFDEADQAVKILGEEGYNIGLVNPRYIKPFDKEMILDLAGKYDKIITVEEGVLNGGFGMMINEFLSENDYKGKVRCFGIDDRFVEHGSVSELRKMLKIDGESIADSIRQWMKE